MLPDVSEALESPGWAEGGCLGWAVGRKGGKGGVAGPLAQGTSSLGEQLMGHRLLELRPDGRR